jgi:hypothetical protein
MMVQIHWTLAQDACTEIRRQVYRQRVDRGISSGPLLPPEILTTEHTMVVEFLQDEFGDVVAQGHREFVAPETLPDVRSWQYPGPWATPFFENLAENFGEREQAYMFSNSGSFTIAMRKLLSSK